MQAISVSHEKPDAGKPYARFDEGEIASAKPKRWSLLCKSVIWLVVIVAAGMMSVSAAVVSDAGVRVCTDVTRTPVFSASGQGMNAITLDWPTCATHAVLTITNGTDVSVITMSDNTVITYALPVASDAKQETRLDLSIVYLDANGFKRGTSHATVYSVTGMNGAATRYRGASTTALSWGKFPGRKAVLPTLACDDDVTVGGVPLVADSDAGGFWRLYTTGSESPATATLTAADSSYDYSIDICRLLLCTMIVIK